MIFLVRICDTYWEATTLSGIFSIFCTTVVVIKMWKYCNFKKMGNPLIPALVVNVAIFLVFEMLGKKTPSLMFILLGIALIVLSLWFLFFSKKVKVSDNVPTGLACGTLSGVMSGLFAMGGPPVVVYFLATAKNNNNEYIATIQTFFLITNLWGFGVKAVKGYVTTLVLVLSAFGLLGILLGNYLGEKVYKKLSPEMLRKIVYIFMAVSGAVTLVEQLLK